MEKYIAIHIATHFMFDMFYGVTVWSAKPMTQSDSLETSTVESGVFFYHYTKVCVLSLLCDVTLVD